MSWKYADFVSTMKGEEDREGGSLESFGALVLRIGPWKGDQCTTELLVCAGGGAHPDMPPAVWEAYNTAQSWADRTQQLVVLHLKDTTWWCPDGTGSCYHQTSVGEFRPRCLYGRKADDFTTGELPGDVVVNCGEGSWSPPPCPFCVAEARPAQKALVTAGVGNVVPTCGRHNYTEMISGVCRREEYIGEGLKALARASGLDPEADIAAAKAAHTAYRAEEARLSQETWEREKAERRGLEAAGLTREEWGLNPYKVAFLSGEEGIYASIPAEAIEKTIALAKNKGVESHGMLITLGGDPLVSIWRPKQ